MTRKVFGLSREGRWTQYEIPDQTPAPGAEGAVYVVKGKGVCIKEFLSKPLAKRKHDKIRSMMESFSGAELQIKDGMGVVWPQELVYSTRGGGTSDFIGYSMPLAQSKHVLDAVVMPTDNFSKSLSPRDRCEIAKYVAALFTLCHKLELIVSDARPANIIVDKGTQLPWSVEIIDSDSFQFKQGKRVFTADVGDEKYSSPRIQTETGGVTGPSISGFVRIREDDEFALAVIIFEVLLLWHPFKNSPGTSVAANIKNRAFAFEDKSHQAAKRAPIREYEKLPPELRSLFKRAFLTKIRVSAREWFDVLEKVSSSFSDKAPSIAVVKPNGAKKPPKPPPPPPPPPQPPKPPPPPPPRPNPPIGGRNYAPTPAKSQSDKGNTPWAWALGGIAALAVLYVATNEEGADLPPPTPQPPVTYNPPQTSNIPEARTYKTSYDCGRANNWVERQVCTNQLLANRDLQVSTAYNDLLRQLPSSSRSTLRDTQRGFLRDRDACQNINCIFRSYDNRLQFLTNYEAPKPPSAPTNQPSGGRTPSRSTDSSTRQPSTRAPSDQGSFDLNKGQQDVRSEIVRCILPDGSELQLNLNVCRERNGLVYK